jgi:hypothetical protein
VSDFPGIPRNDEVSIEDLTPEDTDLPIYFILRPLTCRRRYACTQNCQRKAAQSYDGS